MTFPASDTAARMADAIRVLAMDSVEQARSGHPGAPMGMADMAVALWAGHLRHDPQQPSWFDRDRFVLSNGHASMLLYALLHLTGYDLPIEELKRFRQLHSKTPGHPEHDLTPGVETTTGPLGQGLANAVGFALAEKLLAAEFNRPDFPIVDHFTYAFVGDGCLMEGVSHEACSFAGALRLSRLIVLYDDNGISIDGKVGPWFADDTARRFEAYGWNVIDAVDGHDAQAVALAIGQAKCWAVEGFPIHAPGAVANAAINAGVRLRFAPTLIVCRTVIGKGAPTRAGTAKAHGEPLGADEIAATRKALGWSHPPFEIPADLYSAWDATAVGAQRSAEWHDLFSGYAKQWPGLASEFERRMRGVLPGDWEAIAREAADTAIRSATAPGSASGSGLEVAPIATRKASANSLDLLGPRLAELLGGSADLTGSNNTDWKGVVALRHSPDSPSALNGGRHINYGVREFGMCALMNGIVLHGGFIPYGGTFLTFSDYARNALRMAALMRQRVVYVFTHDSIGLGEDGPTHQPVEHAASLRLIPNMTVWRPADGLETAVAWACAIENEDGPTSLLLSRQAMPFLGGDSAAIAKIRRGAWAVRDPARPKGAILATGSEVGVALAAADRLAEKGIAVRVVSVPSTTVFDAQDVTYKRSLLPDNLPRIAVEAGCTDGWWKYRCDAVVGLDRFGESAPARALFEFFHITPDNVAATLEAVIKQRN